MGLQFSHGSAAFSYSGFQRFRQRLWRDAGHTGDLYEIYDHPDEFTFTEMADPLWPLFNHCDTDGDLSVHDMAEMYERLEFIVAAWKETGDGTKTEGDKLVEGMRLAIEKRQPLRFL